MRISLPVIFVAQSLLMIGAMVAIIASFVVVTNHSIDVAVNNAIENNLETLATSVRTIIRETEPPTWLGQSLSEVAWEDHGIAYQTAERPTVESFNRSLTLFTGIGMQNPRFAYVYQSFQTNMSKWTDLSCGNVSGVYSCTVGSYDAFDYYIESPVPLNYTVKDVVPRDASEDPYILEIRAMRPEQLYNETGYWQRASLYYDPVFEITQALVTFSIPTTFDVDGNCTSAFSIDVSISEVGVLLQSLAVNGKVLYMIDARHLDLLSTSLPASRMAPALFDDDGAGTMWTVPNTPDGEINKGAAKIIAHAESRGGLETEDGNYVLESGDTIVSYKHIRHNSLHWIAVDHTPKSFYFGESRKLTTILVIVACAVLVLCLAVSIVVYFAVVRPITTMSTAMGRISRLEPAGDPSDNLDDINGPALSELRPMHDAFVKLDLALQSFTRYVPRGVVKELIESNQLCKLAMIPRNCSILFSDIAGFTSISERVPAVHLSRLIHSYFSRMSRIVMHHGGIIDKFIGDCIMAIWGAPLPQEHHELRATLCAMLLDREARVAPLVNEFDEMGEQLAVRVGVNSGDVLAGNMGSDERMNYTVIGDNVNLASRLESLNKQMGTRVMISEFTAARLQKKVVLRLLCRVSVVGKSQPVEVYEPRGINPLTNDALEHAELTYMDTHPDRFASLKELRDQAQHSSDEINNTSDRESSYTPSEHGEGLDKEHRTKTLLRNARQTIGCSEKELTYSLEHTEAARAYQSGDFALAVNHTETLDRMYPEWSQDKATDYIRNSAHACLNSRPVDFDGVYHASEK
jgi:class 3 adenylate cyclase